MFKRTVSSILKHSGKLIGFLLKMKPIIKLYNYIFERANYKIVKAFIRFIPFPNINFTWKILLNNGKIVKTKIIKNDIKTMQFAFSYKWHSPSLNFTEKILNNYYPIKVPWIDVGANLGLRSLLSLSNKRAVYFLEPNKELNLINRSRCFLNTFTNYEFIDLGASSKKGIVKFYVDETSYNSSIEEKVAGNNLIKGIEEIKINTLDNIFDRFITIWENACIKIDVEGHELDVLKGAKNIITSISPTFIIEVNEKGAHFENVYNFFKSFDYSLFEISSFKKNVFYKEVQTSNQIMQSNDFLVIKDAELETAILEFSL